jgi:hypothetical protein
MCSHAFVKVFAGYAVESLRSKLRGTPAAADNFDALSDSDYDEESDSDASEGSINSRPSSAGSHAADTADSSQSEVGSNLAAVQADLEANMAAIIHAFVAEDSASSASVYMDEHGIRHALSHESLYLVRPADFKLMTLVEWIMCTDIVELPRMPDGTVLDAATVRRLEEEGCNDPQFKRHREANPVFRFNGRRDAAGKLYCPIYNTHGQRLRSKHRLPIFIPPPPSFKGYNRPLASAPPSVRTAATEAAWYYLALFTPYTLEDVTRSATATEEEVTNGEVASFSYKAFARLMKDLQLGVADPEGIRDRKQ